MNDNKEEKKSESPSKLKRKSASAQGDELWLDGSLEEMEVDLQKEEKADAKKTEEAV